jgi:predicted peptidase
VPADFGPPPGGRPAGAPTGAIDQVLLTGVDHPRAWFHLAVPAAYTPEKTWPLMLVLHGGPSGGADDIISFFRAGLMAKGVISIYPQALEPRLLAWNYPHESARLLAVIRQVARTYRIDPCRIYLVGVSMGGGGTWANGAVLHDVWAGIGPIAGWYGPTPTPPSAGLAGLPIYCLHGQNDQAVPAARSQMALDEMRKLGHQVRVVEKPEDFTAIGEETMVYRVVPGGQHNVLLPWREQGAQELGRMIGWLLVKKRSTPADLPAAEKALAEWGRQFGWQPGGALGTYEDPRRPATNPAAPPSHADH